MRRLLTGVFFVAIVCCAGVLCHELDSINSASWMRELDAKLVTAKGNDGGLYKKELDKLVFPGTHDSGIDKIYDATTTNKQDQDRDSVGHTGKNKVKGVLKHEVGHKLILNNMKSRYGVTQFETVRQQLDQGVRYFDIRFRYFGGEWRIHHHMFPGHAATAILDQFKAFLEHDEGHHSGKEVVFIKLKVAIPRIAGPEKIRRLQVLYDLLTTKLGTFLFKMDHTVEKRNKPLALFTLEEIVGNPAKPKVVIIYDDKGDKQNLFRFAAPGISTRLWSYNELFGRFVNTYKEKQLKKDLLKEILEPWSAHNAQNSYIQLGCMYWTVTGGLNGAFYWHNFEKGALKVGRKTVNGLLMPLRWIVSDELKIPESEKEKARSLPSKSSLILNGKSMSQLQAVRSKQNLANEYSIEDSPLYDFYIKQLRREGDTGPLPTYPPVTNFVVTDFAFMSPAYAIALDWNWRKHTDLSRESDLIAPAQIAFQNGLLKQHVAAITNFKEYDGDLGKLSHALDDDQGEGDDDDNNM